MLTLKLINEETERVIRGLEKKHFKGAREAIDQVLAVDKKRREAQQELDQNLNEAKKLAAQIGALMKEGKKDEANAIKEKVSTMKETNKQLEETMNNRRRAHHPALPDSQHSLRRSARGGCRRGQPRGEVEPEGVRRNRHRRQLERQPEVRHRESPASLGTG